MSGFGWLVWAAKRPQGVETIHAYAVLVALAEQADESGTWTLSRAALQDITQLGRTTVGKALRELRDAGAVEIESRPGMTSRYRLRRLPERAHQPGRHTTGPRDDRVATRPGPGRETTPPGRHATPPGRETTTTSPVPAHSQPTSPSTESLDAEPGREATRSRGDPVADAPAGGADAGTLFADATPLAGGETRRNGSSRPKPPHRVTTPPRGPYGDDIDTLAERCARAVHHGNPRLRVGTKASEWAPWIAALVWWGPKADPFANVRAVDRSARPALDEVADLLRWACTTDAVLPSRDDREKPVRRWINNGEAAWVWWKRLRELREEIEDARHARHRAR